MSTLESVLRALLAPSGVGLVMVPVCGIGLLVVLAVACGRWREARRASGVVDIGTYRQACQRVECLVELEQWQSAYAVATAICAWTQSERHVGSAARRRRLNEEYRSWSVMRREFDPGLSTTTTAAA